jgi:hypothetical protein
MGPASKMAAATSCCLWPSLPNRSSMGRGAACNNLTTLAADMRDVLVVLMPIT